MQSSKLELIEAFIAMNERTRLEIIKERFSSIAYEAQVRNFLNQEDTLPRKKSDKTLYKWYSTNRNQILKE